MVVQFHTADIDFKIKHKRKLGAFIGELFLDFKRPLSNLGIVFCTDDYLLTINRNHLQHDYFTDIITFDLSDAKLIVGELYISIDRVKDNAGQLNQEFIRELHRVIFHGCLHLCGLKDKSKTDSAKMRLAEEKYLDLYFS